MKLTPEDFSYERAWRKFILRYDGDLGDGYQKDLLLAYCFAIADKGSAGRECCAGDETIGREIGRDKDTARKYRHKALELGWLVPTGQRKGRCEIMNICIPIAEHVRLSEHDPAIPIAEDVRLSI